MTKLWTFGVNYQTDWLCGFKQRWKYQLWTHRQKASNLDFWSTPLEFQTCIAEFNQLSGFQNEEASCHENQKWWLVSIFLIIKNWTNCNLLTIMILNMYYRSWMVKQFQRFFTKSIAAILDFRLTPKVTKILLIQYWHQKVR